MRALIVAALGLALVGVGCASSRSDVAPADSREFVSRDVLTYDQIAAVRATNSYDAVARLKSHWLRSVTPTSPNEPAARTSAVTVYLDDQRLGGVDQLRGIEIAAVRYIRYFSPAEASARWGFNNSGGAILVSTRPQDQEP